MNRREEKTKQNNEMACYRKRQEDKLNEGKSS
jgi:hypothetical protein